MPMSFGEMCNGLVPWQKTIITVECFAGLSAGSGGDPLTGCRVAVDPTTGLSFLMKYGSGAYGYPVVADQTGFEGAHSNEITFATYPYMGVLVDAINATNLLRARLVNYDPDVVAQDSALWATLLSADGQCLVVGGLGLLSVAEPGTAYAAARQAWCANGSTYQAGDPCVAMPVQVMHYYPTGTAGERQDYTPTQEDIRSLDWILA